MEGRPGSRIRVNNPELASGSQTDVVGRSADDVSLSREFDEESSSHVVSSLSETVAATDGNVRLLVEAEVAGSLGTSKEHDNTARAGFNPYTIEDVLRETGTSWMQKLIVVVSAVCYGHFSVQTMIPTLTAAAMHRHWRWLDDEPYTFNAVFAAGAFARLAGSLLLVSWIDILGRRFWLVLCLALSSVAAVISAAAPNFAVYCVFRTFVLLFTSVLPSASTVYAVELVQIRFRALPSMVTQFTACVMMVGVTYAAAGLESTTSPSSSWRWTTVIGIIPGLLALIALGSMWVETPRFLAACRGDPAAAWKLLFRICKNGESGVRQALRLGLTDPFPPPGQFQGCLRTDLDFNIATGRYDAPWWLRGIRHTKRLLRNIVRLAASREYRRLTMALGLVWTLQSLSYWGLATYSTTFYKLIGVNVSATTAGSFAIQVPGQLMIYHLMEAGWSGRIWAIRIFTLASVVTFCVLGVCLRFLSSYSEYSGWLSLWSLLCFMFTAPVWGPVYAFTAECYPTTHRGTAMALHGALAAGATVVTTYVGSSILSYGAPAVYPLVWGALRLALFAATWIFPKKSEMKNKDLKDVEATVVTAATAAPSSRHGPVER